ncbi:homoserine kinase [Clostridium sp.]|uniref:homoserine kinase n=1 Tax=Clostridium sp. TaxID=1506 RepID=UPI003994CB6D
MRFQVKVPATSANIGAGFDVMGMALSVYNVFEVEEIKENSEIIFEGFELEYSNRDNIFYKSMILLLDKYKYKYNGFKITLKENNIPIARGLGSSSSCIVGGLIAANKIMKNKITKEELVKIATDIEGHPDNVSPAILGGLVVTVVEDDKLYYNKVDISEDIVFSCYIPNFKVSTEEARKILPKKIKLSDGIYNVGHSMLTLLAFINKDYDLLKISCRDKFHQNYRGSLIEGYENILCKFDNYGAMGTFISGSGPTIIGIFKSEYMGNTIKMEKDLKNEVKLINLIVDNKGAQVEER